MAEKFANKFNNLSLKLTVLEILNETRLAATSWEVAIDEGQKEYLAPTCLLRVYLMTIKSSRFPHEGRSKFIGARVFFVSQGEEKR